TQQRRGGAEEEEGTPVDVEIALLAGSERHPLADDCPPFHEFQQLLPRRRVHSQYPRHKSKPIQMMAASAQMCASHGPSKEPLRWYSHAHTNPPVPTHSEKKIVTVQKCSRGT